MYASISAAGTTVTSAAAASAAAVIPNSASGTRAKYVRVTGTTLGHIKFGGSAVAATVNDILVSSTPSLFYVGGHTHFSVIEQTAACKINIMPVDM